MFLYYDKHCETMSLCVIFVTHTQGDPFITQAAGWDTPCLSIKQAALLYAGDWKMVLQEFGLSSVLIMSHENHATACSTPLGQNWASYTVNQGCSSHFVWDNGLCPGHQWVMDKGCQESILHVYTHVSIHVDCIVYMNIEGCYRCTWL